MKRIISVFIMILAFLNAFSQPANIEKLNLAVKGKGVLGNEVRELVFKPNSRLKIRTLDGEKISAKEYSLLKDSIVVHYYNYSDAIALSDIKWIKGKVFKDKGRKILGGVLTAGAIPVGFIPVLAVALGSGPGAVVLFAVPFVGMLVGGISLMGARRFNTYELWDLKTIPCK